MIRFSIIFSILHLLVTQCFAQDTSLISKSNELFFVANEGQVRYSDGEVNLDVLFTCNIGAIKGAVRQSGITYQLSQKMNVEIDSSKYLLLRPETKTYQYETIQVNMDFVGSNTRSSHGWGLRESYSNYFLDNESNGIIGVKEYNSVELTNVYDGIDVLLKDNGNGFLEYDFIVHPVGNPNDIVLEWNGADSLSINQDGSLSIYTALGELREYLPEVYQLVKGKKSIISSRYVLQDSLSVGVFIEEYVASEDLVIDPFVTYFGGERKENSGDITTDYDGNIYVCGSTNSLRDIGFKGHQNSISDFVVSAFLTKFNKKGERLWSTYYGGSDSTIGSSIVVDGSGDIYLGGTTNSEIGIAYQGFQNKLSGTSKKDDAFIAKFNRDGGRVWSTYYGGVHDEQLFGLCTDGDLNVIICGVTHSISGIKTDEFPSDNIKGHYDAFIVKLNKSGDRIWGRYYGGSYWDILNAVACDANNDIVLAGYTNSTDNISYEGYKNVKDPRHPDAMLIKLNEKGERIWSTYYGGTKIEGWADVVIDENQDIYMIGQTNSSDSIGYLGFQTELKNPQPVFQNSSDGFLVKFDSDGVRKWGTYLGGSSFDRASSIVYDTISKRVMVSGTTFSNDFPITSCAYQTDLGENFTSFLTQVNADGSLYCSTYFGEYGEYKNSIAVHGCYTYLTGHELRKINTTEGAHKNDPEGSEVFIAQLLKSTCGTIETKLDFSIEVKAASCAESCDGEVKVKFKKPVCSLEEYSFRWSNGSFRELSSDTIDFQRGLCSGESWVLVSSGCISFDTIFFTVTINDSFSQVLNLSPDLFLCEGDSLILKLDIDEATFLWSNGSTESEITVKEEGSYKVLATYESSGCVQEYSSLVLLKNCFQQKIPTAITPNGDGLNDVYRPVVLDSAKNYQLLIANRWGEILFKSSDHTEGWNAKYKNEYVAIGIYLVSIYYVDEFGIPHYYNGTLRVLR